MAFRENRRDRLIDLVIVVSLLVDVVIFGITLVQYRCIVTFCDPFCHCAVFAYTGSCRFRKVLGFRFAVSRRRLAAMLLLGMLWGSGWHGFMTEQRVGGLQRSNLQYPERI